METSRFCFELPPELIAQRPPAQRSAARLMLLERAGGTLQHLGVRDLPGLLQAGTVLVLNDTRVLHARLTGHLPGGRTVPFLLLEATAGGACWTALAPGARRLPRADGRLSFPGGVAATLTAGVGGTVRLTFTAPVDAAYLERHGAVPLPPYIRRGPDRADADRYQTVYATTPGVGRRSHRRTPLHPSPAAATGAGGGDRGAGHAARRCRHLRTHPHRPRGGPHHAPRTLRGPGVHRPGGGGGASRRAPGGGGRHHRSPHPGVGVGTALPYAPAPPTPICSSTRGIASRWWISS